MSSLASVVQTGAGVPQTTGYHAGGTTVEICRQLQGQQREIENDGEDSDNDDISDDDSTEQRETERLERTTTHTILYHLYAHKLQLQKQEVKK